MVEFHTGSVVGFHSGNYGVSTVRNKSLSAALRSAAKEVEELGDTEYFLSVAQDKRSNEWQIIILMEYK